MNKPKIQKATMTKTEVMQYLGIGKKRLSKLMINPNFPRQKAIIEKWSKSEIDIWLNNYDQKNDIKTVRFSDIFNN